jgi:rRNA maturation RNase YbeY
MKSFQNSSPRVTGRREFDRAGEEIRAMASGFAPFGSIVEVNLVGEKKMAWLNRTYKGGKGSVEILTFRYPPEPVSSGDEETTTGEIYICWKKLLAGARRRGVPARAYLLRLVVHGLCHLEGYTHGDEKSESEMEKAEMGHLVPFLPPGVIDRLFA